MTDEELNILSILDDNDDILMDDMEFANYLVKAYQNEDMESIHLNYFTMSELREKHITGNKLYKLWKSCDNDIEIFEQTALFLTTVFIKPEIHENLNLQQPVPFFQPEALEKMTLSLFLCHEEEYQKEINNFQKDFVTRVNRQLKKEGKQNFLKVREVHKTWNTNMDDDEKLSFDHIYIGIALLGRELFPGNTVFNECFAFLEKQKIPFRYYHSILDAYRVIPSGEFVFLSGNYEVNMQEEIAYQNHVIYEDDNILNQFHLVSLPFLLDSVKNELKHDFNSLDKTKRIVFETVSKIESLKDMNGEIKLEKLQEYEDEIQDFYYRCYGESFQTIDFNISKYQKKIVRKYH